MEIPDLPLEYLTTAKGELGGSGSAAGSVSGGASAGGSAGGSVGGSVGGSTGGGVEFTIDGAVEGGLAKIEGEEAGTGGAPKEEEIIFTTDAGECHPKSTSEWKQTQLQARLRTQ